MRKNFMLSLTAMAALPMAGFADATWSVPTNKEHTTEWQATEGTNLNSSSNEQIIGIGAGISQKLTLVKGKYTVTVAQLSNAEFAIRVGDKTYSSGEQFELTDEENTVTLKVTTKDATKQFTVGGISVKLIFDFDAAKSNLTDALNTAVGNKLANAAKGSWQEVLSAQKTAIEGEIAALAEDKETYETAELYKTPSKIGKAIQHLADCIAVLEAFDEMDSDLADLKTEITSEFAKEKYEGKVKELETDINNFKAGFDYSKNYENLFATTTKDGWLDDVNNAKTGYKATIKDYSTKIKDANEDAAAFNRVAGLIDTAKGNYYTYQTDLKFHGNTDYATLSTNALEKLAAAYLPILKQEDIKCSTGYRNQEAKYRGTIEAAEDAMSKVRNTFMGYYDNLEQTEFATLNGYAESVKKYEEAISDDELTVDANYAQKAKEAIQNAKDELKKVMADVSDNGLTLPENYYALRDAANDAVNYLKVNYLLASANSAFTAANTAVEGLVKGKYHESSFWTEKVKSIQQTLNTFGGYTDDKKVANEKVISDISSTICAYKADAQAAFDKYDAVTNAIDFWTKKYDAVVAFVDNRTVPFESTTYGKALEDAKDKIDKNQDALNIAVGKTNTDANSNAHAKAMDGLSALNTTTYLAILDATKEGYTAAKNKHEWSQTIASARSLAAEVEAKATYVFGKLTDAWNKYNGKDAEYGKSYQEVIWGGNEATADATKDNFWGIRKRYYNVDGVKQDGPNKGTYTADVTPGDATYDKETYDKTIANIQTLSEHRKTFEAIDKALDALDANAADIKAKFVANKTAYEEFVKSLKAAKEEAEKIKTVNKDTSREKEFSDLYDEVTKSLGDDSDFKKSLDDSKKKETFIADRDKAETGFKATLDGINADITKHIAAAEASTANYNAWIALTNSINDNLYEQGNKITVEAYNSIHNGHENNPGHQYFAGEVTKLATAIETLESNVRSDYTTARAASTNKAIHEAEITRIMNGVAAAKTNCTANDENYAKLDALNKDVEDFYIKIYYKISETDKTSEKDNWLKRLAEAPTVDQKGIDEAFANGKLIVDDTDDTYKYKYYVNKYTERKEYIEDINALWINPGGYLLNVNAANRVEFTKVTKAYNAAVQVYLDAIKGLQPFLDYDGDDQRWNVVVAEHNAIIFDAKKALDKVYADAKAAYETISKDNSELKKETVEVEVEKVQYFNGSGYYSETGTIFEKREAISEAYKKAIEALNADTKERLTKAIGDVEANVKKAINEIPDWYDVFVYQDEVDELDKITTDPTKFFGNIGTELDKVKDLLNCEKLAVDYLDSKKDTAKDYDKLIAAIETTMLPAALNKLAEAQYGAWIADKEAKDTELHVKANENVNEGLFDIYPEIADKVIVWKDGQTQSYKTRYAAAEETLEAYLTSTPTYDETYENGVNRMQVLNGQFEIFNRDNGYKDFKDAVVDYDASEAAYKQFIGSEDDAADVTTVTAVQRIINGTASYAPEFIAAAATIAGVQSSLNDLKAKADEYHATYGKASYYDDLLTGNAQLTGLNTVKTNAEGLMVAINQAEYDALVFQLANLKSDYNQALNEGSKESDDMKAYHERILAYEAALTPANFDMSDTKKDAEEKPVPAVPTHTYDKLLAIQDSIVADRNDLAGVRVDGIYKALVANLNGLTERYAKLADNCAKLYTYQQNAIALKEDKSGELLASVEASNANRWILIEEKSLKDRIDSWTDYLDEMEPKVATALDVHDTDAEARQRLQDELNVCKTYVENMLNSERFQQFNAKDYWDSHYQSWYGRFVGNNQQYIDSEPQSDGELKNEATKLFGINTYNSNICSFERYSYRSEVDYRYNQNAGEYTCVSEALDNLYDLLTNKNILNKDTYDASYDELSRKKDAAWTFFYNIYNGRGYTDVDINGDRIIDDGGNNVSKYYSHQAFVTEVVPAVIGMIESILADAAKLKSDIEENTYVPGDLSGDKKVSLADFATLQSIILSKPEVDDEVQKAAADLNKDGFVDISDLMLLVRQILTPTAPAPARVRVAIPHATTNDAVSVIVEGEGVHQRIGIMLDAEQAYAGCQMDITLPEGVTLAEETTGEMAGALSLLSNDLENGSHRILLSSVEGLTMATGNGALLWLDVNVDHNYNGEGIGLSNVLFANSFGRAFELSVAAGETTGLSNVSMTQEVKEKIYNVGGILMDGLKRGVNIIRGNDGSSKKVIVK